MSWSSLPDDVVHVILAKVCLIELARITTTSSSFHAAYSRRMALEQEARRQLAVNTFGTKRIACVFDLIVRLLARDLLPPGFVYGVPNWFWVGADGVLHGPVSSASPNTVENGDIWVYLGRGDNWRIVMVEADHGRGSMEVLLFAPNCVFIKVSPTDDKDFVPVALAHALLGEGLPRVIRNAGYHADVDIGRTYMKTPLTQAGLKAQVAPLLPLVYRTPLWTQRWWNVLRSLC